MKKLIYSSLIILVVIFGFSGCGLGPNNAKLHIPAGNGNLEAVKKELLINKNINRRDAAGQTALIYAASSGHLEMVKYLVENGASIDIKASFTGGKTALVYAATSNKSKVIQYLIDKGANINAVTIHNETALFYAVSYGNIESVKVLLKNNADKNIINKSGQMVYTITKRKNIEEITNLLNNIVEVKVIHNKNTKLEQQKQINLLIKNKDYKSLKNYTDKNPNSVYYIKDEGMRLALTGPKGLKVGDIRKYIKNGKSELIIISLINRSKTPYKEFSMKEIDMLLNMGLSDKIVSAMIDITTKLLETKERKKEQQFLLSEQQRITTQKDKVIYKNNTNQKADAQDNPVINKVQDEVIKQGVGMLLDHFF